MLRRRLGKVRFALAALPCFFVGCLMSRRCEAGDCYVARGWCFGTVLRRLDGFENEDDEM
jgi:hypothetical protein